MHLGELSGPVLVLAGDTPLLTTSDMQLTLDALAGKSAAVLTAHLADATGYGRIVRNQVMVLKKLLNTVMHLNLNYFLPKLIQASTHLMQSCCAKVLRS
jgi:bifunctional N-acetylglucosamine-1-phosphate-uridyltransferase/glucosamine-1-phosphate-acetyltransferase GlmU-like protein